MEKSTSNMLAEEIIAAIPPLEKPRGSRLPFIVWGLTNLRGSDRELEEIFTSLNQRGIAPVLNWNYARRETNLEEALRQAGILQRLGLPIVVNTTGILRHFCDGSPETAHRATDGTPFFDHSQSPTMKIGCPFTLHPRIREIRAQVETYVQGHLSAGIAPDILIADWEIDGPIEWNQGWEHAKRCTRCRRQIPDIDHNFAAFQKSCRDIRAQLQRESYADVVRAAFPHALVGNYAEYPHNGWRYWYDYFEEEANNGLPFRLDGRERERPWQAVFPATGYTFAMPVVYTWRRIYDWYDDPNSDFRWFHSMLKVVSNAGQSKIAGIPLITFVHWHTTAPPAGSPAVPQMSKAAYTELLWHALLRGHDAFAMWCLNAETLEETQLVHSVYTASLAYRDFLDRGEPQHFDIPAAGDMITSALRLGNRLLIRRTRLTPNPEATMSIEEIPANS